MRYPYVPGFLAFQEAPFRIELLEKLKISKPDMYPQCLMLDGNGIFHKRRCGIASHLGVLCDLPAIGIAKTLYSAFGVENNAQHRSKIKEKLLRGGDYFELHPMHPETDDYIEAASNIDTNLLALCYLSFHRQLTKSCLHIDRTQNWLANGTVGCRLGNKTSSARAN